MTRGWKAFDFQALPSFSKRQAAAWSVLASSFAGRTSWQTWVAEGLAPILETPAGFVIRLRQRHTVDPQQPESVFTSDSGELALGREQSCDVRLTPRSVANRHARIYAQAGRCYLEDLGGAIGTFLNDARLAPNQPAAVATGDQFTIFPYRFTIEITERWARGGPVVVSGGPLLPLNRRPAMPDRAVFVVQAHPVGAEFLLEADRAFLSAMAAQALAPLCSGAAGRLGPGDVDGGLFELFAAAVLERINRDLQFPLQAILTRAGDASALPAEDGALAFSFVVRIGALTGAFRLLIGDKAIRLLASTRPSVEHHPALQGVSWKFVISAGWVELTRAETAAIEPADIVLLTREWAMLFPTAPERGWRLRALPGNLSQSVVDNYFERGCLSNREAEFESTTEAAPDLAGLPVHLHAIVGEKEMTLADAAALAPGSILELDASRSDPVRIALNGKIAGSGELVEVDGRLGIRILSWRT